MISARYISQILPKELWDRYSDIEHRIIVACAEIFRGDDWVELWKRDRWRAEAFLRAEIEKIVYSQWPKTQKDLAKAFEDAAVKTLADDEAVYRRATKAGLIPTPAPPIAESAELGRVLAVGYAQAKSALNLTNTTAVNTTIAALDEAFLMTLGGRTTLQEAINAALNGLAAKGITGAKYPGGGRMSLAPYVRMVVQTSVMRTTSEMSFARAAEWGSDLIQISSHAGAREKCFPYQGRVFVCPDGKRTAENAKYPMLVGDTSYGEPDGLFGINCRHFHMPWFEGLNDEYTEEERYPAANDLGVSNNVLYEQTQEQRYNERQIRAWKHRRDELEKQGIDSSRPAKEVKKYQDELEKSRAKVKEWQKRQRDFIDETGLPRQYDREKAA